MVGYNVFPNHKPHKNITVGYAKHAT